MRDTSLLETLPADQRLAIAYAPMRIRQAWLAGLALDVRLARIVLSSREAMLGQIRLAWWRDRLAEIRPVAGEPLVGLIFESGIDRPELSKLVDSWEGVLLDDGSGDEAVISALADARAGWIASLDPRPRNDTFLAAREWTLADLCRMTPPDGPIARRLADSCSWRRPSLPRTLRPLAVLHALARRNRAKGDGPDALAVLTAARVGLLGV